MPRSASQGDLVVLVADTMQEAVVRALLVDRRDSLRIRPVTFEMWRHPHRDPGVYQEAAHFLRPYRQTHDHALVLLDAEWEGAPGAADALEANIGEKLRRVGWADGTFLALAIAPEIESWAWRSVATLAAVLDTHEAMVRGLAESAGWWRAGEAKPHRPKELLEATLRAVGKPLSSSLYARLAGQLSLRNCRDASFGRLSEALQRWFPAS